MSMSWNYCPHCQEPLFDGDCTNRDCNAVIVPPEALLKPLPQTPREHKLTEALLKVEALVDGILSDLAISTILTATVQQRLAKIRKAVHNGLSR